MYLGLLDWSNFDLTRHFIVTVHLTVSHIQNLNYLTQSISDSKVRLKLKPKPKPKLKLKLKLKVIFDVCNLIHT